jgi:hypothetical protein
MRAKAAGQLCGNRSLLKRKLQRLELAPGKIMRVSN